MLGQMAGSGSALATGPGTVWHTPRGSAALWQGELWTGARTTWHVPWAYGGGH